jgi:hypothetical protein
VQIHPGQQRARQPRDARHRPRRPRDRRRVPRPQAVRRQARGAGPRSGGRAAVPAGEPGAKRSGPHGRQTRVGAGEAGLGTRDAARRRRSGRPHVPRRDRPARRGARARRAPAAAAQRDRQVRRLSVGAGGAVARHEVDQPVEGGEAGAGDGAAPAAGKAAATASAQSSRTPPRSHQDHDSNICSTRTNTNVRQIRGGALCTAGGRPLGRRRRRQATRGRRCVGATGRPPERCTGLHDSN